jgi:nitroreductase
MDIIEGIETRRSIRAFTDTPIPEETLDAILKAAANSPSYTNTQPWEAVVVCGNKKEELRGMLCELAGKGEDNHPDLPMPKGWPPAHEVRSREHGQRRLAALGVARDDEEERQKLNLMNFEFYGAPCAIFLFMDSSLNGAFFPEPHSGGALLGCGKLPAGQRHQICPGDQAVPPAPGEQKAGNLHILGLSES